MYGALSRTPVQTYPDSPTAESVNCLQVDKSRSASRAGARRVPIIKKERSFVFVLALAERRAKDNAAGVRRLESRHSVYVNVNSTNFHNPQQGDPQ
jgi:hypothetical protein